MSQTKVGQEITSNGEKTLETLAGATVRFRLKDPKIDNREIASTLMCRHFSQDHSGTPNCCFWWKGSLAAIRTKPDEIVIFRQFGPQQDMIGGIADQIID